MTKNETLVSETGMLYVL